jgi:NPCBM/NEW2 domain-containing protein
MHSAAPRLLIIILITIAAAPARAQEGKARKTADTGVPGAASQPSIEAVPPAPEPRPGEPVVETITGMLQGPLRFPAGDGGGRPSLQVGARAIPLEEALFARFAGKPVPYEEAFILLRNGDHLFASLRRGDESEVRLGAFAAQSLPPAPQPPAAKGAAPPARGDGEVAVALESIRGIGFPRRFRDPVEGASQIRRWFISLSAAAAPADPGGAKPAGAGEDRVFLTEGAELTGILQKIDAEAVHFQSATAGDLRLPLAKVRAVLMSEEISGKGDRGEDAPPSKGISTVAQFLDGSVLSGRLVSLIPPTGPNPPAGTAAAPAGEIRLATKALGEVAAPLDRVLELSFLGGRCRYLSDLKPAKVSHKKDYFHPRDLQLDLSAAGDPLSLRARTYRKGLGMLSHTRADYDLAGRALKFQALIGMDDRARPETVEVLRAGGGTAVFRVYVDDEVKFEKLLSWSDPALPISIPTEGAKVLGLELDYGKGFLVLGFGDWAEARIILKD